MLQQKNLNVGSNNIDVCNKGVAAESNTIRIGRTGTQTNAYIAGISDATVPTGVAVIIDARGHLGTTTSSARFKEGTHFGVGQTLTIQQSLTFASDATYQASVSSEMVTANSVAAEGVTIATGAQLTLVDSGAATPP